MGIFYSKSNQSQNAQINKNKDEQFDQLSNLKIELEQANTRQNTQQTSPNISPKEALNKKIQFPIEEKQIQKHLNQFDEDNEMLLQNNEIYQVENKNLSNNLVGKIKINDNGHGTGTLIGKDLVLTCAHNLYSKDPITGKQQKSEKMTFKLNYEGCPELEVDLKNSYCPLKYLRYTNKDEIRIRYDYAILKLLNPQIIPSQIQQQAQKVQLDFSYDNLRDQEKPENLKIQIYGFFGEKITYKQKEYYPDKMYYTNGFSQQVTQNYITHKISTIDGFSGASYFVKNKDKYKIVGIHKGKLPKCINSQRKKLNIGIRLTQEIKNQMVTWYNNHKQLESLQSQLQINPVGLQSSWKKKAKINENKCKQLEKKLQNQRISYNKQGKQLFDVKKQNQVLEKKNQVLEKKNQVLEKQKQVLEKQKLILEKKLQNNQKVQRKRQKKWLLCQLFQIVKAIFQLTNHYN